MKVIYLKKIYLYIAIILILILSFLFYWIFNKSTVMPVSYLPITNKIIGIDPGHGGVDPGTVSRNGVKEDEINLQIALKLKRFIEQSSGIAIMTRDTDKGLYTDKSTTLKQMKSEDLKKRKEIVEKSNCDIFITIHLNSFPQSKYYGAQTFYKKDDEKSKRLSIIIQEELKNVLDKNNNRVPQHRDDLFLLKEIDIPTILIECGFLSNPKEEQLLSTDKYQEKIAWAIYVGIMRYFSELEGEYGF